MSAFHVRPQSTAPSHVCAYISQTKDVRTGDYLGSVGSHCVSLLHNSDKKLALLFASNIFIHAIEKYGN